MNGETTDIEHIRVEDGDGEDVRGGERGEGTGITDIQKDATQGCVRKGTRSSVNCARIPRGNNDSFDFLTLKWNVNTRREL